jgi:hypothetical protein
MQDIDFEELDRAVSSVLGDAPASEAVQPASESIATPTQPTAPQPSPAARRTPGRFMDVVHPSSDMKTPPARPAASPVLTPLVLPDEPEQPSAGPVVMDIVKAPVTSTDTAASPPEEVSSEANESSEFRWPDPLDVASDEPSDAASEGVVPETDPIPAEPISTLPALDSPFISDAKVEKRPLGAFSDPTPPPLDLEKALQEEEAATQEESPAPAPEDAVTETPEESDEEARPEVTDITALQGEDLEVSEESLIGSSDTDETSATVSAEAPVEETIPAPTPVPTPVTVSEPNVPLAAASIPQQYKEQPLAEDQPSGAIYDTETYHQPLTHPAKKTAGWLVVIWIIALILFGGGIGAALYFFVLPML